MEFTELTSPRKRLPRYLLIACATLIIGVGGFSVAAFVSDPSNVVIHYGRLTTQRQLANANGTHMCVQLPIPEPIIVVQLLRQISRQPEFICFDTDAEARDWMRSMGIP